jgi:two-component system sensor histidine kinase TctE
MKNFPLSIRTQLLLWLVIPMMVLLLVGGAFSYGLAISLATDAYDRGLLDTVYSIARCIERKGDKITCDVPPAALAIMQDDVNDRVYYQVLDEKLNLIAGDKDMPALKAPPDLSERTSDCHDGTIGGEEFRIAVVSVPLPGDPNSHVYVQVGEAVHQREHIADQILIGVTIPECAILALSGLLVWFGVRRGLVPLSKVRDAVASRSPIDLSPLDLENVPKEVRPLVTAINDLLGRLQQDLQAQRRFVANAAHQLRTPIAGLKTQSELALRQKDPAEINHALGLIHTGAARAARLANQLLALARAEPEAVDSRLWREIDLNAIGKNTCHEFVSEALSKKIDLGFEASQQPVYVRGDESSLHELACNLVHNAVQYTQEGGHVTVRIEQTTGSAGNFAHLVVEDNGPGIPAQEREHVFERFYRLDDRLGSGSGLGLAIVREIANMHGGEVDVGDGPGGAGTRVTVRFKSVSPNPPREGQGEQRKERAAGASAGDKTRTGSMR